MSKPMRQRIQRDRAKAYAPRKARDNNKPTQCMVKLTEAERHERYKAELERLRELRLALGAKAVRGRG